MHDEQEHDKRRTAKNADKMNLMEHLHISSQTVAEKKTVTVIWKINDTSQGSMIQNSLNALSLSDL